MSNQISSMFLNEMTVVDHAFIDDRGFVVGGSFNPSFIVSGEVDEVEQVVVDFSTIKKDIKALIDHRDIGFDHKLWVSRSYSNTISIDERTAGRIRIITPHVEIDVPTDAVRFFDFANYDCNVIGEHFGEFLTTELRKKYPTVTVNCVNTTVPHTVKWTTVEDSNIVITDPLPIRYHHGLKNSTSYGCANLFHGHLSFIQFETNNVELTLQLADKIQQDWHGSVYIFDENLSGNVISYNHPTRGFFSYKFSDDVRKKVFPTETTIENLISHLATQYHTELIEAGVSVIYFSEGLSKGAVVRIK